MKEIGIPVQNVHAGSIASELGVEPGDRIKEINGQPVHDLIDYRFFMSDEYITVNLEKPNGEVWELEIEKDYDEDIGLEFGREGLGTTLRCRNKCIFCFVDQMPPDMRETLYVKDDDYRLSFLQGNFITLTNLVDRDFKRIINQRLSPLFISVHTTNPELRVKMLGTPRAGEIMDRLRLLAEAGIEMHTQAVLCPGINDGEELGRTVQDLSGLWPGVRSLALVPVGLTAYREGLYPLQTFTREQASEIVSRVAGWQNACLQEYDYPLVFASDEFYLLAGAAFPPAKRYADFPQTENGVGLVRLFLDEWERLEQSLPSSLNVFKRVTLLTGRLGAKVIRPLARRLNSINNLSVKVITADNHFFGNTVTVAGLLTSRDIKMAILSEKAEGTVIIPAVTLRSGDTVFLDNKTLTELEEELGLTVRVARGPEEILNIIANTQESGTRSQDSE